MPRPPSPFVALLADLKATLDTLGVGWYVFGAQAALLYGSARLTADVDVTVAFGERRTELLVDALRTGGFALRVSDPAFVRATRVLPTVHAATGLPVDVVLGGPGLEEHFLERAQPHDMGGVVVPVARAEDIVVMKILAGRDKDRADIAAILGAQRATLDIAAVQSTLGMIEEALGQSDLLPAFERALRDAASER